MALRDSSPSAHRRHLAECRIVEGVPNAGEIVSAVFCTTFAVSTLRLLTVVVQWLLRQSPKTRRQEGCISSESIAGHREQLRKPGKREYAKELGGLKNSARILVELKKTERELGEIDPEFGV